MEYLIKIENDSQFPVDARELHAFLESKQQFGDWIKNRIKKYEYVNEIDYRIIFSEIYEKIQEPRNSNDNQSNTGDSNNDFSDANNEIYEKIGRGRPTLDYKLTIDCAKELAMIENNQKGKTARRYFIEVEKLALRQANEIMMLKSENSTPMLLDAVVEIKEAVVDAVKDTMKDVVLEVKDAVKESVNESVKDAVNESVKDAVKESVKDAMTEVVSELKQDGGKKKIVKREKIDDFPVVENGTYIPSELERKLFDWVFAHMYMNCGVMECVITEQMIAEQCKMTFEEFTRIQNHAIEIGLLRIDAVSEHGYRMHIGKLHNAGAITISQAQLERASKYDHISLVERKPKPEQTPEELEIEEKERKERIRIKIEQTHVKYTEYLREANKAYSPQFIEYKHHAKFRTDLLVDGKISSFLNSLMETPPKGRINPLHFHYTHYDTTKSNVIYEYTTENGLALVLKIRDSAYFQEKFVFMKIADMPAGSEYPVRIVHHNGIIGHLNHSIKELKKFGACYDCVNF